MAQYLLFNAAIFDDDLYEMSRLDDPEKVVQLGAATSRCLQVLLEAEGQIVKKGDLLYKGWEQYHNVVTSNSVNQAVANIRKNFALLNLPVQNIVTVPRIGYKIADNVTVEKIDARCPSPISHTISTFDIPSVVLAVPEPIEDHAPLSITLRKRSRETWWLSMSSVVNAVLALGAWWFFHGDFTKDVMPVEYIHVNQTGDIHYFAIKNMIGGSSHMENSIAVLHKYPPVSASTNNSKYVYINGALRDNVYSYFLCQNQIEKVENNCVSYLALLERAPQ